MAQTPQQTLALVVPTDVNPTHRWEWLLGKIKLLVESRYYGRMEVAFEAGKMTIIHLHSTEKPP